MKKKTALSSPSVGRHDDPGRVVEKDADDVIGQLEAEAVFVGVVHPLCDPHDVWIRQWHRVTSCI